MVRFGTPQTDKVSFLVEQQQKKHNNNYSILTVYLLTKFSCLKLHTTADESISAYIYIYCI